METCLYKYALSKQQGQSDFDYYIGRMPHDIKQRWYGVGASLLGGAVGAALHDEPLTGFMMGSAPGMLYKLYHDLRLPYDSARAYLTTDKPKLTAKEQDAATKAMIGAGGTPILGTGVGLMSPMLSIPILAGGHLATYDAANKYNQLRKK